MRWFNVIVPIEGISSFNPFDMEASLSQTATLLGRVAQSEAIRVGHKEGWRRRTGVGRPRGRIETRASLRQTSFPSPQDHAE